jgi:flagellar basal-body rod modification protein FlgD
MISPITTPQYFAGASNSTTSTAPKQDLDKDAFLKLLVEQLKHQDPTTPMDGKDLAAQLAQFTSVEQLTQLNTNVQAATQASQMTALTNQSALSASLIGRQVEATGDMMSVGADGAPKVTVDISGSGGKGTLTLTDSSGDVIATRDLGTLKGGDGQTLTLPGDLPAGTWHYSLAVKGADGSSQNVTTYVTGVVNAVEFKNGKIVLNAGGLEISLDDLVRIEPSGATLPATPPAPTPTPSAYSPAPLGTPLVPIDESPLLPTTGRH